MDNFMNGFQRDLILFAVGVLGLGLSIGGLVVRVVLG